MKSITLNKHIKYKTKKRLIYFFWFFRNFRDFSEKLGVFKLIHPSVHEASSRGSKSQSQRFYQR